MKHHQDNFELFKYIVTFIITAGIFITVFFVSKIVNEKKLSEIRSIQEKISIDLLSSETQFALLKRSSCTQDGNSLLAPEIGKLGERLSFMEGELGIKNENVISLKKYYSLLQIKDYLLGLELSQECDFKPIYILYFYKNDCSDCEKQGYALTALREKYPELRVYSFDADLELSAITTLQTLYKVQPETLPTIVVNEKRYDGFQSIETIEKLIPELKETLKNASDSTTSTTPSTTKKQ
jgi:glutaredoxin